MNVRFEGYILVPPLVPVEALPMPVFDHPEFDQHESLHFVQDVDTGLQAIIAIHSTALGPAAGGCRRCGPSSTDAELEERPWWRRRARS